ncbi:hypothetical protein DIPPA_26414 [Diplonema papillatum]|nr:hypothetical protein DIPPA_26414 [Diplonema papillatum]
MMKQTTVRLTTRVALELNLAETYKAAGLGAAQMAKALPSEVQTGLYIGGEFVKSRSGKTFITEGPATGKPISRAVKTMKQTTVRLTTRVALELNLAETYKAAGLGAAQMAKALPSEVQTGLYIGGEFVKSRSGKTFITEDPATGKPISRAVKTMKQTTVRLTTRVALELNLAETYKAAGLGAAQMAKALPSEVQTGLYIGGEFVKSRSGKTFITEDPATGKPISRGPGSARRGRQRPSQ